MTVFKALLHTSPITPTSACTSLPFTSSSPASSCINIQSSTPTSYLTIDNHPCYSRDSSPRSALTAKPTTPTSAYSLVLPSPVILCHGMSVFRCLPPPPEIPIDLSQYSVNPRCPEQHSQQHPLLLPSHTQHCPPLQPHCVHSTAHHQTTTYTVLLTTTNSESSVLPATPASSQMTRPLLPCFIYHHSQ